MKAVILKIGKAKTAFFNFAKGQVSIVTRNERGRFESKVRSGLTVKQLVDMIIKCVNGMGWTMVNAGIHQVKYYTTLQASRWIIQTIEAKLFFAKAN